MILASWNVNSIRVRLPQVLDWLAANQPQVLCLQETKTPDVDFPFAAFQDVGYHAVVSGQKTYNGVAIIAQKPPTDVLADVTGIDSEQRRLLAVTVGGVRIVNAYVPNGSEVGSGKYAYKLGWLQGLKQFLKPELRRSSRLVLAGDFNIAPEDRDVHDPEAWRGSVLVSEAERSALAELTELGLVDVFRRFDQASGSFSWWDYRAGAFRRNHGLRIDLILCSAPLACRCRRSWIDREARSWQRPSDHAPVVAEFRD